MNIEFLKNQLKDLLDRYCHCKKNFIFGRDCLLVSMTVPVTGQMFLVKDSQRQKLLLIWESHPGEV